MGLQFYVVVNRNNTSRQSDVRLIVDLGMRKNFAVGPTVIAASNGRGTVTEGLGAIVGTVDAVATVTTGTL